MFCLPRRKWSRTSCSTFKMLQHFWSLGAGNMSVVCLGWCTMTCTGWLFLSERSTSLLWQSIVVFGTELQGILSTASLWSWWSQAPAICQIDVINCQFREFTAAPSGPVHFLSPDQESGIHCVIICAIQLLTPNNLGEAWICLLDIRSVSALEVLRNRALQFTYLLTYLLWYYWNSEGCLLLVKNAMKLRKFSGDNAADFYSGYWLQVTWYDGCLSFPEIH